MNERIKLKTVLMPDKSAKIADADSRMRLYKRASMLAVITVFYNLLEGLVSVAFGISDESIALFGFGVDSFVEVISGLGIWHMTIRLRAGGANQPDRFESRALRITGAGFYALAIGLALTAVVNLIQGRAPETTFWGVVISLISIITMWMLIRSKTKVGRALNSDAILADAACTRTCLYLSFVLLAASLGFELTGIGGLDSIGAALIAVISFKEGREAFAKAKGRACSCAGACAISGEK